MTELPRKSGPPPRIRFEDFEADLRTEELFKSGTKLRLPHQSFCVLAMLLERAGQLVTREELRARLWPAGTLIEYDPRLNAAVNRLREALLDSAEAPRFIETLPKRGYRFIAAIEPVILPAPSVTPDLSGSSDPPPLAGATRSRRKILAAAVAALSAIVLIAVTIFVLTGHSPTPSAVGRQVIPLASLPGKEIVPTFSPDGSQVAFAWNEGTDAGHQFDLYVKSLGSERLLRLTHHPSRWISPAWSPDGSAIAFVRQTDEGAGILVVPALGGSERSIVTNGVTAVYIQISWSPDGRRLAYSAYGPTGAPQVYIVSLDTANTRPLSPAPECSNATEPAFSPDEIGRAHV